jgi:hypothetical protein
MTLSTAMQTSYDRLPGKAAAGMAADSGKLEVLSAHNLAVKTYQVTIGAIQNSTEYKITFSHLSRAAATVGQTISTDAAFTSDSTATAAEILAGLLAAVNASAAPVSARMFDASTLEIYARSPETDYTPTVSANLTLSAELASEVPFGVLVVMDGDRSKCRLPKAASDVQNLALGVALRTLAKENTFLGSSDTKNCYAANSMVNAAREGRVWVPVEGTIAAGDSAFVRHTAKAGNTQKGKFRNDRDGTAQVATLTPTEQNAAEYMVDINGYTYTYLSDSTGAAAEIVAALLALINVNTAQHGVVATGTATLILTASVAGVPFHVNASANLSIAATTANAATAEKLERAKFLSASESGLALLQFDII